MSFLVSPLISLVGKQAGSLLIQQFSQMYGLKKKCETLRRRLQAIQAVIGGAEQRMTEPAVQEWLQALHAVAIEALDVLDLFKYHALRQEALAPSASSSRMNKVMKRVIARKPSPFFRYKMGKKLKNVLGKINEIITEMNIFNFVSHASNPPISRPQTQSNVIESDIIGRDGDKWVILEKIIYSSRENKENISVLPIVGMGGVGKTALAQVVCNEEKVKQHFQLQMWVSVRNEFNVENIVKSMIEVANNGACLPTSNLDALGKHLRDTIIAEKSFLVVLDDVGDVKSTEWKTFKDVFPKICSKGVIIVTTRSKDVVSIVGTLPHHDLAVLSEKESWKLFCKRAFGVGEKSQQLVEIGRKIVGECAGLPLALNVIGALMRTKRKVHEWRAVLENPIWYDNEVLPALKLSYDELPPHMKQCVTFCATFPQGFEMEKKFLTLLWKAHEYIPSDGNKDPEKIFNELCSRCFFQDIRERDGNTYCKMHDLTLELLKRIAGKQCASRIEDGSNETLHLSISGDISPDNLRSIVKNFPALRTLLIFGSFDIESGNGKLSDRMKLTSLRALKMKSDQIPFELGYMKHLRLLDLSWGKFDFLPETICTLYLLETLDISYSQVSKLPDGIGDMINLRHLIFEGCKNLKKLPAGLAKCNLETLTEYMVDSDPAGLSIRELNRLNNLRGHLVLSGLENVRDENEAKAANMDAKTEISSLELKWDSFRNSEESARKDQQVLEGLKINEKINDLAIDGYEGIDFPIWMKGFASVTRNLVKLKFSGCINCTSLPPLWQLPLLKNLELLNMKRLVYICSTGITEVEENGPLMFPYLEDLVMDGLENLEGWHEKDNKVVAFSVLMDLEINNCPKLTSLLDTPCLSRFRADHPGRIKLLHITNMPMVEPSKLKISLDPKHTLYYDREGDTIGPPTNVKIMEINDFENVIPLEEGDEESCQQMSIPQLVLMRRICFFFGGPSNMSFGFWQYFGNLKSLIICLCDTLFLWPEQELRGLKCLESLRIVRCYNFTYSSRMSSSTKESYGEDFLPRLELLQISDCPKLTELPNICSRSLKHLELSSCGSLSKEGFNWLKNLHELNELFLGYFKGWDSLPDSLEGLASLERLAFWCCPGMESLPEGFQQRLPQLQFLEISLSPTLEQRCGPGGDYEQFVSVIPKKVFTVDGLLHWFYGEGHLSMTTREKEEIVEKKMDWCRNMDLFQRKRQSQ